MRRWTPRRVPARGLVTRWCECRWGSSREKIWRAIWYGRWMWWRLSTLVILRERSDRRTPIAAERVLLGDQGVLPPRYARGEDDIAGESGSLPPRHDLQHPRRDHARRRIVRDARQFRAAPRSALTAPRSINRRNPTSMNDAGHCQIGLAGVIASMSGVVDSIVKPSSSSHRGMSSATSGSPPLFRQFAITACTNSSNSGERGSTRQLA